MNRSSSYIPSSEIEVSPMYSQPNLPARLYFSPTFLQDEESEPIRTVLSPLDQNQTNKHNEFLDLIEPKVIIHRISQRFLLKHLASKNNDRKPNTIALRKRKSVSIIEIEDNKPKKTVTKRQKTKSIFNS